MAIRGYSEIFWIHKLDQFFAENFEFQLLGFRKGKSKQRTFTDTIRNKVPTLKACEKTKKRTIAIRNKVQT